MTETLQKYVCENCLEEFDKGWSDEEASVEFIDLFPDDRVQDAVIVCDDCWHKLGFE